MRIINKFYKVPEGAGELTGLVLIITANRLTEKRNWLWCVFIHVDVYKLEKL